MRYHRYIKYCMILFAAFLIMSCKQKTAATKPVITQADLWVDTGMVPRDTVLNTEVQSTRNGLILLNSKKFSGYVADLYPDKKFRTITSVYEGMIHGMFRSYYENGALHEVRQYKENVSTGKHYGLWANGNKQFDYVYFRDRKIGYMNRWYENGKPYLFLNYKDDKEEGLQQGWRENGKLFINYVAKDGYRYGLQETMLCYKLNEGNIIK
jgi:antitoxin component YwqK of YwqJK toxin-antitoxin module